MTSVRLPPTFIPDDALVPAGDHSPGPSVKSNGWPRSRELSNCRPLFSGVGWNSQPV